MLKLRLLVSELRLKQLRASIPLKNFTKANSRKEKLGIKETSTSGLENPNELDGEDIDFSALTSEKKVRAIRRPHRRADLSAVGKG